MKLILELRDKILKFSPGDVVAAVEIQESVDEILSSKSLSEKEESTLLSLKEEFSKILEEGIEANLGDRLNKFINLLEKLFTFPDSEISEEENSSDIYIEDREILDSFLVESKEHLEGIEDKILQLEKEKDPHFVNAIFRSMHTIKGVASFIGFTKIKDLSHTLESLLDLLRKEEITISTALIDDLLEGIDLLNIFVNDIAIKAEQTEERTFTLTEFDLDIDDFISRIQGHNADSPKEDVETNEDNIELTIESFEDLVTPEMIEKFVQESADLIDEVENNLLALEKDPTQRSSLDATFRNIHTLKGNAGFFWFKSIEHICMNIETLLDSYRKNEQPIEPRGISTLLGAVDEISKQLSDISSGKLKRDPESQKKEEVKGYTPLGDLLVDMGVVSRDAIESALELQQMKLGELLVHEGAAKEEDIKKALQSQGKAKDVSESISNYSIKRKDIRVDTERLDKLFNLMGELITAEAMVVNNPDLADLEIPNFSRAASYMSKISREMQEITMTIRMIPLEGLFNKMRRLVRDLSRKFSKEINLFISGEETEMDRNVMEEISDPMVHIIRNSIDHGIEDLASREKRGKSPEGSIHLAARYEGNEIWITIKDDGGGLDREKILKKAVGRGLVEENQEISDSDVWKLIFEPGFSTADKVSEISGRGVGMDVVKRNIEKLRGKIDIKSEKGIGTQIVLKIPLTLAIIDGINYRVGTTLYSVPINDVIKFHKPTKDQLTSSKSSGVVLNLYNELIPVVSTAEFFKVKSDFNQIEDGLLIIVSGGGKKLAMAVDDIIGYKQLVVKALPEYMGNLRAISGCSILGDGNVSLILDTGAFAHEVLD